MQRCRYCCRGQKPTTVPHAVSREDDEICKMVSAAGVTADEICLRFHTCQYFFFLFSCQVYLPHAQWFEMTFLPRESGLRLSVQNTYAHYKVCESKHLNAVKKPFTEHYRCRVTARKKSQQMKQWCVPVQDSPEGRTLYNSK